MSNPMEEFNTKIEINGEVLFLHQPKDKWLEKDLFNLVIDSANLFVLNDDGEVAGTKEELKEFNITPEYSVDWNFTVNDKSRDVIKRTFKGNSGFGHRKWILKGDDFELSYKECGDETQIMEGPDGKETVCNYFKISSKNEELLKKIKKKLDSYKVTSQ
jgi:hypothetical protein